MLKEIEEYIRRQRLFKTRTKLLLGISGGVDSVVLATLLSEKYDLSLAHCNFKLRGKESDEDEKFCLKLAKKLNVPIYVRKFNTAQFSKKEGISIQMAARQLRYDWFEELLKKHKLDLIVTAHHANDQAETFFINLIRGCGIKGLKGMESKNGRIVRPLLEISKKEILSFAEKKKISYREDSSNSNDKYDRNFIRLQIIPLFKKLNPSFDDTMIRNMAILGDEHAFIEEQLQLLTEKLRIENKGSVRIRKKDLLRSKYPLTLLHVLLDPFGFNYSQSQSILRIVHADSVSGKRFLTESHILAIGKEFLQIEKIGKKKKNLHFKSMRELQKSDVIRLEKLKEFVLPGQKVLIVREKDLLFPLQIRGRKEGDRFEPFGMKGSKLLSDFLKDEKIEPLERDKVRILENGNGDLIWIIGLRSNDRYRINTNEKGKFIKLSWLE